MTMTRPRNLFMHDFVERNPNDSLDDFEKAWKSMAKSEQKVRFICSSCSPAVSHNFISIMKSKARNSRWQPRQRLKFIRRIRSELWQALFIYFHVGRIADPMCVDLNSFQHEDSLEGAYYGLGSRLGSGR